MEILELTLFVPSVDVLQQQQAFYIGRFGFEQLAFDEARLAVRIGASTLTFAVDTDVAAVPHRYHFALNIPSNRFAEGVAWLRERAPLIRDSHGRDLFDSPTWHADIAYFYDPAGNIGELIARHTLPGSDKAFSIASISRISEIGVACDDVPAGIAAIHALSGARPYHWTPPESTFAPMGDALGLFILVERGRVWFPDTGVAAEPAPFRVVVRGPDGQPVVVDNAAIRRASPARS